MMNLKQYQYFVTIAECGSISKAAKKLNMSQPPLSLQLKQIEEQLQTQLIDRSQHHFQLTQAGEILYRRAKMMIELDSSIYQEIQKTKQGIHGTLRLGAMSSCGPWLFEGRLQRFQKQFPFVHFEIMERNTYQLLELLEKDAIDVAIVRTPFDNEKVEKRVTMKDHLVAVASSDFLSPATTSLTLQEIAGLPLITYRRLETILQATFERQGLAVNWYCLNDDARTSLAWAKEGMGIALVPYSALSKTDDVVILEIEGLNFDTELLLVTAKKKSQNEILEAFVECCR